MGAGAVGAIAAADLARLLQEKYGKPRVTLVGGLVTIGVATGLAILQWISAPPIAERDLVSIPLAAERIEIKDSKMTILHDGGRRFVASSGLWRPRISDQALEHALRSADTMRLWIGPPGLRGIFGIDAGSVQIPPSVGVERYMRGRLWFEWLWGGVLALGVVVTLRGAWLIWTG